MKAFSLVLLAVLLCNSDFAQKPVMQTDTTKSVYGKLVTRKDYTGYYSYGPSKDGTMVYKVNGKEGEFIKQTPEQLKPEVWAVKLEYHGTNTDNQAFTPQQFTELEVAPKFKNRATTGITITSKLEIYAKSLSTQPQKFSLADFHTINVQSLLAKAKIPVTKTAITQILIFVNRVQAAYYSLKITQ